MSSCPFAAKRSNGSNHRTQSESAAGGRVYADNNASSTISAEALRQVQHVMLAYPANPSSVHVEGRAAARVLTETRARIAMLIGAPDPGCIYFTSGGSESNNMVMRNVASRFDAESTILYSAFEHDSVIATVQYLTRARGRSDAPTAYALPVTANGYVDLDRLTEICTELGARVGLVCVMLAQNEIGTIQPVLLVKQILQKLCPNALLMVDATQMIGKYYVTVESLGFPDFVTASAHKFHGPRGVGFVYARRGLLAPEYSHQTGGHQEGDLRAGTENLPGAAGMATALQAAVGTPKKLLARQNKVRGMRDRVLAKLSADMTRDVDFVVNGDPENGLYNTLSLTVLTPGGEHLAQQLDRAGIDVSSASACTKQRPSHVLAALHQPAGLASHTIRISLSEYNTEAECDRIAAEIARIARGQAGGSDAAPSSDGTDEPSCPCKKQQQHRQIQYLSNGLTLSATARPSSSSSVAAHKPFEIRWK
jgi:cysteine desulfurase